MKVFVTLKKLIDNHLVVNDTAKCGIKLITDLNTRITFWHYAFVLFGHVCI